MSRVLLLPLLATAGDTFLLSPSKVSFSVPRCLHGWGWSRMWGQEAEAAHRWFSIDTDSQSPHSSDCFPFLGDHIYCLQTPSCSVFRSHVKAPLLRKILYKIDLLSWFPSSLQCFLIQHTVKSFIYNDLFMVFCFSSPLRRELDPWRKGTCLCWLQSARTSTMSGT